MLPEQSQLKERQPPREADITFLDALRRALSRLIFLLGAAALLSVIGWMVVLMQAIRADFTLDETRPADAILLLGAGVEADGTPTEGLRARIIQAAELYHKGCAPLIIVTGGTWGSTPTEASTARTYLVALGVPLTAVVVEDKSLSTVQNIANVQPILAEYEVESVLLVTSPYHQWRAQRLAQAAGLEAYASPAVGDPIMQQRRQLRLATVREAAAWIAYTLFRIEGVRYL